MAKVKISELPSLTPATLDTTYVVGISGSTTYKISINQLTSSLDTTFATDLVTAALSSSLNGKLSTSSYTTDSSSFDNRIKNSQPIGYLTTASYTTDSSSFNSRIISGSAVAGTISGSSQISALGYATTSSVTTISASAWGAFQSASSYSSSLQTSITTLSSSVVTLSSSVDSRLDILEASASSDYINVIYSSFEPFVPDVNSAYKFNATPQGNIVYDNTTGYFTLIAGKIYNLNASIGLRNGSEIIYQWYDATNNQYLGVQGGMFKVGDTSNAFNHSPLANAIVTPSTNINVYLRSTYRDSSNNKIQNAEAFAEIKQIGKSEVVNNIYQYVSSSTYTTDSSSFNSRIISGSAVAGTISGSAQISAFGFVSGSYLTSLNGALSSSAQVLNGSNIFSSSVQLPIGLVSGSSQLTTAFPSKTTGTWSVPAGASTQSFSVESGASYTMWVNGNIPNGIITWNAIVTTANTNVPAVGSQYGWYYTPGNALVLTAMPDQIVGTNGSIANTPTSYAPNTSNVFKFGITNNSGTTQTINYGYIKLS